MLKFYVSSPRCITFPAARADSDKAVSDTAAQLKGAEIAVDKATARLQLLGGVESEANVTSTRIP